MWQLAWDLSLGCLIGSLVGAGEVWHPPLLVRLIQSLHDRMMVEVSVDGATTPVIEVNNGLW